MRTLVRLLLTAVLFAGWLSHAEAGARRFTYVYEADTAAPGSFELENWITWKHGRVDFRHELEFGITDRLQMAIYVADWSQRYGRSEEKGARYNDSAVELMYNLSNPQTALLGSAIYGELKVGDELVELEGKVILQKNFGPFVLAYNATLEAEWEGHDLEERKGEFQQSAGLSYEISPRLLIGGEILHEIAFPGWKEAESSVVYAGPNVAVRAGNWWATASALAQLTNASGETDFQVRTIVGYSF